MRTVPLEIVTPDRKVFSGEVSMIIARGGDGEIGILPGHTPLITNLKIAPIRIKSEDGLREEQIAVSGGFLEVKPTGITVLATSAEKADEIDVDRAEKSRSRAEQRLANTANLTEHEIQRAQEALERANLRLNVAKTVSHR